MTILNESIREEQKKDSKQKKEKLTKEELLEKEFNERIKSYDEVKKTDVEWIWYPYIPKGKIVFVLGDPGSGKTFFSTYLASVISRGGKFYNMEENIEESVVVLQNGEDGKSDTIKNRLIMLNAHDKNIIFIDETKKQISLKDYDFIEYILKTRKPLMIIFDPTTLYIGKKVDMNSANEVRNILNPIVPLLEKYGCTLLLVLHMNKSANKSLYKALGSIDFVAIARSVITISVNPVNNKERLLMHTKASLGIKGDTLAFEINNNGIEWIGIRDIDEDTLEENSMYKKDQAKTFILEFLHDGNKSSDELINTALEKGFSQKTFENARSELKKEDKIDCFKDSESNKYYWHIQYPF